MLCFPQERKAGQGQLRRTGSLRNDSRRWAIGWSLTVCYLALGYLGQRNIGLVNGGMNSGLVGLYMEGMYTEESFTILGLSLPWGGSFLPGQLGTPKTSEHHKI